MSDQRGVNIDSPGVKDSKSVIVATRRFEALRETFCTQAVWMHGVTLRLGGDQPSITVRSGPPRGDANEMYPTIDIDKVLSLVHFPFALHVALQ
jgi:hypothetical protein